ncbi:hypothetical protein D3C87_1641390 [compost metagenome]
MSGAALGNTAALPIIASSGKWNLTPGNHVLALLGAPTWTNYRPGNILGSKFRPILDQPVAGANAHFADIYARPSAPSARLWKVIALDTGTESLGIPHLPEDLRSYGLSIGTDYDVQVGAAVTPLIDDGDNAQTLGQIHGATYFDNH